MFIVDTFREAALNDINMADIMDTIHIELHHTIRITPNEISMKEEELKVKQGKSDDEVLEDVYARARVKVMPISVNR